MSKQPDALRLGDELNYMSDLVDMGRKPVNDTRRQAAAELRRQHALISELVGALEAICDEQDANEGYAAPATYDAARAALAKAKDAE